MLIRVIIQASTVTGALAYGSSVGNLTAGSWLQHSQYCFGFWGVLQKRGALGTSGIYTYYRGPYSGLHGDHFFRNTLI